MCYRFFFICSIMVMVPCLLHLVGSKNTHARLSTSAQRATREQAVCKQHYFCDPPPF